MSELDRVLDILDNALQQQPPSPWDGEHGPTDDECWRCGTPIQPTPLGACGKCVEWLRSERTDEPRSRWPKPQDDSGWVTVALVDSDGVNEPMPVPGWCTSVAVEDPISAPYVFYRWQGNHDPDGTPIWRPDSHHTWTNT